MELAPIPLPSSFCPMTQKHPLDQKGSLVNYPLAELIIEIAQAKFSGSLRLSNNQQKTVVYFDKGQVVFAVSNSKTLRLFNILLQQNKIDKKLLAAHPSFANDLEFSASLQAKGEFTKEEVDAAFSSQIDAESIRHRIEFAPRQLAALPARLRTRQGRLLRRAARRGPRPRTSREGRSATHPLERVGALV